MSTNQHRNDKKLFGKDDRDDRRNDKEPGGKRNETDQSRHETYRGYDEEKINRTDHSQQIGEFSNWSERR